jgi:hypothetical protein
MKIITAMFVIVPLIAAVVAPAHAFDAKSFFEQQERQSGGTGGAGG